MPAITKSPPCWKAWLAAGLCSGARLRAFAGRFAITDVESANSPSDGLDPDFRLRDAIPMVHASGDLIPLLAIGAGPRPNRRL